MEFTLNDLHGRQVLRQIMDKWPALVGGILPRWKKSRQEASLNSRAGDTYGTPLAAAELLLGQEAMAIAGVDVSHMAAVGELAMSCVAGDLAEQTDNWQESLTFSPGRRSRPGDRASRLRSARRWTY